MLKEKSYIRNKELSINVEQTKIDSLRRKTISKTGLRIYRNGLIGTAGTIGNYDEQVLEEQALAALHNRIPYPYELTKDLSISERYTSCIISEQSLPAEVEELLELVQREQPGFIFSNRVNLIEQETGLSNNAGLDLYEYDRYVELNLLFKETTSVNIYDGAVYFKGRQYDNELILKMINQICDAYKNKHDLPREGRYPVIFETGQLAIPLRKVITGLHGETFGSNSSPLSDRRGQQIFSDRFTLYQASTSADIGTPFFDAEGVVNEGYCYTLIEEGRIITPYTNKKFSQKFDLPLTGAATAEYDGVPTLGWPNLRIRESEKTVKELLGGRVGIYVIIASGGDFTHTGDFSTPVQLALFFDGERFVGRLPELNISSNIFRMCGEDFIGVSKDSPSELSLEKCLLIDMNVSKI